MKERRGFLKASYVKTGKKEGRQLEEGGTVIYINSDEQKKGPHGGQKQGCISASPFSKTVPVWIHQSGKNALSGLAN